MSGRVEKRRARPSSAKTSQSLLLASNILSRAVEMSPCSPCARRGPSCLVSNSDSSRCSECVRLKLGECDVHGPSHAQLRRLASQQIQLEADLDSAEEEAERAAAKVRRLRRQKKLWAAKVARAVARGLDNLEELEALERQEEEESRSSETAVVSTSAESSAIAPAIVSPGFELPPDFDWSAVELDPALFALGSPLVDPGASGDTGQSSQGNSTNA